MLLVRREEGAGQMDFTQAAGRGQKATGIAFRVVQYGGELTPCTLCSVLKAKWASFTICRIGLLVLLEAL